MGLDGLIGDGALGGGHGLGDGGRSMDGWGSNAMSNASTISTIASLGGAIGDGGSQTGVSNKLVRRNKLLHCFILFHVTTLQPKMNVKLSQ